MKTKNTVIDMMRENYGPRKGLEGPFNFSGRVLYYDPREGQYYDPTTDFYVEYEEWNLISNLTKPKLTVDL